jgi:probable phosphoglycerate mutase
MTRYPALWERWVSHPDWDLVPGGELAADFEDRVSAALDSIRAQHESGDVLVVTHGGVIQVALGRALGWPGSRGAFPFRIQNTSLNVLEIGPRRAVVSRVNDTAHLGDDPIPA